MAAATVEALVSPAKVLELSEATLRKTSERVAHQDIRPTLGLPVADVHVAGRVGAFRGQGTGGLSAGLLARDAIPSGRCSAVRKRTLATRCPVQCQCDNRSAHICGQCGGHTRTGAPGCLRADFDRIRRTGGAAYRHYRSGSRRIVRLCMRRDADKARAFADVQRAKDIAGEAIPTAQAAVEGADIVCTITSAARPVLKGEWLTFGTPINAVGASVAALAVQIGPGHRVSCRLVVLA
jgi:Ornithine cyclodeaminase/mu-crystallin family